MDLNDEMLLWADFIMMNETWLSSDDSEIGVDNFDGIIHKRRNIIQRGGGVAIYHSKSDTKTFVAVNFHFIIRLVNCVAYAVSLRMI